MAALEAGQPARAVELSEDEAPLVRALYLLTAKPQCYAANVGEADLTDQACPLSTISYYDMYARHDVSIESAYLWPEDVNCIQFRDLTRALSPSSVCATGLVSAQQAASPLLGTCVDL